VPAAGTVAEGQWANGQSLDQNRAPAAAPPAEQTEQAEQQLQQEAAATQVEAARQQAAQAAAAAQRAQEQKEEEEEEQKEREEEERKREEEEKQKEADAAAAAAEAAAAKRAKEKEEEEEAKKLEEKKEQEQKEKQLTKEKQRTQEELEQAKKAMQNILRVAENVGWEVQTPHFINVRSAMQLTAPLQGKKHACDVLDAHQEGDWIKLNNEPGYLKLTFDTNKLLREVGFSYARLSNITCFDVGQIPVVIAATCSRAAAALQLPATVAQTTSGKDGTPEGCYLIDNSMLVLVSKSVEQSQSLGAVALAKHWEPVCYTSPTRCSLGMPETTGMLTTITQTTTTTTGA